MTPYDYRKIEVHLIDVPEDRLRAVKPHRVETLAKDMAGQGQLQPVIVTEEANGRFTLVKGLQRLEAVKANKGGEIDARVTKAAWLNARQLRLQAIMATLNREDFTRLERAEALAELKTVYEELYPEAKKGGDKGNQHTGGKKRQNEIFSFSQKAAEATGFSRRSIELAVAMANGLSTPSKARLRGSFVENDQCGLIALSRASETLQHIALDLLFAEPAEASSVGEALLLAEGRKPADATEKAFRALQDKWKRFPIRQKRSFVTANQEEILRILGEEGLI